MSAILSSNDKLSDGHYTVVKELGVGGMGVVYQCRDEFLERDVAIKMLLPELVNNPKNLEVFKQEAKLAAQLEHPNIVTVYDIGVEKRGSKQHYFVAMEYLPGGNLGNQTAIGALPVEHAINWMKQLANGLHYAHKMNVVHQDVKADNIFINKDGDLKIGDFGLARLMENKVFINPSTKGMGTPAYMSPELCRGEQQDHRSDIYSLGVLFFEMATGQLPYRAEGMIEMAMKHTTAPIPSARRLNPLVPSLVDKLIRKMMEKSPDDRFQSLEAIIGVLDELIFELRVKRMGIKIDAKREDSKELLALKEREVLEKAKEESKSAEKVKPAKSDKPKKISVDTQNVEKGRSVQESNVKQTRSTSKEKETKLSRKIPLAELEAVGIKLPQEVGPIRKPTKDIAKELARVSQAKMPALAGLDPLVEKQWEYQTKGPIGWRSKPVLSSGNSSVYIGATDFKLYKLSIGSGDELWQYNSGAPILSSPAVDGDRVYIANNDGLLACLKAENGETVWERDLESGVVSTPVVNNGSIIAATKGGRVCCLNARTGNGNWAYDSDSVAVSGPSFFGKELFFGTRDKNVYCLDLKTGKKKWKAFIDGSIVSTPAVSVDSLYVGTQDGAFYALDVESGEPLWDYYTDKSILSSPVISFTSVVFTSLDKWIYCCEKYDGRLRWKSPLKGRVQADLAVVDKNVVTVTREGWMQSFSMNDGQVSWVKNFGTRLESTPLFLASGLILATIDGKVTFFSYDQIPDLPKSA